jgi:hypothetical protein
MYRYSKVVSDIEVEYARDLSKPDISFSLGAIGCVLNREQFFFFIFSNVCVVLTSIAQKGAAEELFPSKKADHDCNGFVCIYQYFLVKHDVNHLALNVSLRKLLVHFWGTLTTNFVLENYFKVYITRCNMEHAKPCKHHILPWNK